MQEYNQLQKSLEDTKWILSEAEKDIFMGTLLSGKASRGEIEEEFTRHGINLDGNYFCAMVIFADGVGENENDPEDTATWFRSVRSIVCGVLSETSSDLLLPCFAGAYSGMIPVILSIETDKLEDEDVIDRLLCRFAEGVVSACEKSHNIRLHATAGQFYEGFEGMKHSYAQAIELNDFLEVMRMESRAITYSSVTSAFSMELSEYLRQDNELELRFRNQVQTGSFGDALETLREIVSLNFGDKLYSIQRIMSKFNSLKADICFLVDNMRLRTRNEFPDNFNPMPDILHNSKSVFELMACVEHICESYVQYIGLDRSKGEPAWVGAMKDHILENLSDPNMNASTLSDMFGLNAAYSARVFKLFVGTSLPDYIHMLRVEKAIDMIESNMLIKDVALAVGYDNPLRMSRAFKRFKGMSPLELRQSLGL